jgi:hypothetical protein
LRDEHELFHDGTLLLSRVRSSWVRVGSFTRLLQATTAAARGLNHELVAEHGITIEQDEVLSRIARTPEPTDHPDISDPPLVTAANVERVL